MAIILEESAYSSHFLELLNTDKRYVIAYGGRGSGKTYHIVLKLLLKSFESQYNHIVYVNKEKAHIKSQQYATLKLIAKQIGLYDLFRWYDGDYRIINNVTGTVFTPIGMDDPEKTKGLVDATIIWWDEISKGTQDDFTTLNALLRTPKNKHQFIVSFNPVSEKHWLRGFFFGDNPYELKKEYSENTYLNHSTYLNNDFIDKPDYYNNLLLNANGNLNKIEVDVKGLWGVMDVQNVAIPNFNEQIHVNKVEYNPIYPLIFSCDFNSNPLVTLVCQEYNVGGVHYLNIIDEIVLENAKTQNLIEFLNKNYSQIELSKARFTGDATGRKETTAGLADWKQLIQAFRLGNRLDLPNINPNVIASIELCNYVFYRHKNVNIHPKCTKLIYELQYTEADEKGLVKKNRKNDAEKADALDCMRYFFNTYCLIKRDIFKNKIYFNLS
jgi:phage terminase large subunit